MVWGGPGSQLWVIPSGRVEVRAFSTRALGRPYQMGGRLPLHRDLTGEGVLSSLVPLKNSSRHLSGHHKGVHGSCHQRLPSICAFYVVPLSKEWNPEGVPWQPREERPSGLLVTSAVGFASSELMYCAGN